MNAQTPIEAETLLGALAKALPELESAKKNRANPAFKSKYADLGAVIEAIHPIAEHGIWFRQISHDVPEGVCIETMYIHANGEELSAGKVFVPADKKNAQGYGSAQSYARRYGLQAAFGLATEDDDGNAASAPRQAAARGSGGDNSGERQVSPTGPVSDADLTLIMTLCQAVGGGIAGTIMGAYNVTDLSELNPRQAKAVIERLNEKLAEKAKAETNREAQNV